MRAKAREHGIHIIATIFESVAPGLCYDSAIVIDPAGEILGRYRKAHPAAVRSLEKIYFRYGSHFPVFRIGEWRVGIKHLLRHVLSPNPRAALRSTAPN